MSLFFLNVTPVKSPYLLHRRTDPVFFFGCCTPSHPPTFNLDTQTITCSSSSSSSSQRRNRRMEAGPAATMVQMMARDRVIDFGKHRGRMLGSLPSGYLRWMSENLRAREMEEWSKLADEVLQDPVYRDRLEWEFAEAVLKGNSTSNLVSRRRSAVSELVEISERFGWDNEDKLGWSRIDLQLLGTSMGGRIPRRISSSSEVVGDGYCNSMRSESSSKVVVSNSELGEKMMRRRRREIRREIKERSRRGKRSSSCHMNHGDQLLKPEVEVNNKLHTNTTTTGEYDASATDKLESWSIFPGRQELLRRGIPPIRC